jgi:hypothetical protein
MQLIIFVQRRIEKGGNTIEWKLNLFGTVKLQIDTMITYNPL